MLYELLYILPARHTDAELPELQAKITSLIEAAGVKVVRNESAGKLKLAYAIKNNRYGQFFLVYFEAPEAAMQKVNEALRLSTDLGRYQISRATMPEKESMKILSFEDAKTRAREDRAAAPSYRGPAAAEAMPEPVPAVAAKPSALSMEDLDKKLDQILNEPS
ncbi:30S ribosomal protein S6 [Patescibacteria group bacterium]|nr:30S ribosomal protein S6 [Patescibacteria group bacterium]